MNLFDGFPRHPPPTKSWIRGKSWHTVSPTFSFLTIRSSHHNSVIVRGRQKLGAPVFAWASPWLSDCAEDAQESGTIRRMRGSSGVQRKWALDRHARLDTHCAGAGENEAAQKMRPPSSSKLKYHECHAFFFAALAFAYRSAVDWAAVAVLAGGIRVGISSLADSHRAADIARIFDTG